MLQLRRDSLLRVWRLPDRVTVLLQALPPMPQVLEKLAHERPLERFDRVHAQDMGPAPQPVEEPEP